MTTTDGEPEGSNIPVAELFKKKYGMQAGNVIFAQNWGYFWNRVENDADTKVKGKVGVTTLPHDQGGKSATCIGGWQLAVSAFSKNKAEAEHEAELEFQLSSEGA